MRKIVYEKKYDEELNIEIPEGVVSGLPETGKEFLELMEQHSEYVLNQERMANLDMFIERAKSVSEIYEFDTSIEQFDYFVQVSFEMTDCPFFGSCKNEFLRLLVQADDFSIHIKNKKALIVLTYNTQAHYYKGKLRT